MTRRLLLALLAVACRAALGARIQLVVAMCKERRVHYLHSIQETMLAPHTGASAWHRPGAF